MVMTYEQCRLVEDNMDLCYYTAHKWRRKIIRIGWDDILSACMFGITNASHTFDPDQSKFATYAVRCMDNEVLMLVRKHETKYKPLTFLSQYEVDDDTDGISESLECLSVNLEFDFGYQSLLELAKSHVSQREWHVIYLYYYMGYIDQEIADHLGITKANTNKIKRNAIMKIRSAVDEDTD